MSSILHVHGDKRTSTTTPIEDAKAFPLLTLPTEILLKIFSYLKREDLTQVKSCNNKSRSIVQQSTFNQFKISYNDLLKNLSLYLTNDDNALLQKNFTSFNQKAYASIGYQIGITLPFDTSKERETLRLTLIECLAKSNKAFNPDSPDCLYIVARDEFSDRAIVWKNAIALPHEFSEILICASALYFFSVHCNNPNNSIQNKIELTKILGISYISPTYPIVLVRDYHTLILKNIKAALSEQNYCIAVLNALLLNTDRPAFFCTAIEAYLASNQYDYNTAKALIQADDPKKHSLAVQTWIFEKQIHHFEGSFAEKWNQTFQRYFTDLDKTDRSILETSLSLSYISHRQFEDLLTVTSDNWIRLVLIFLKKTIPDELPEDLLRNLLLDLTKNTETTVHLPDSYQALETKLQTFFVHWHQIQNLSENTLNAITQILLAEGADAAKEYTQKLETSEVPKEHIVAILEMLS